MKLRLRLIMLVAAPIMFAVGCSTPSDPGGPAGTIVLRFEPPVSASRTATAAPGIVAATFDSVVVNVFRPGAPITRETYRGAALDGDPVELALSCVAEKNKRVGVDLFEGGVMTYHGANTDVDVTAGERTSVTVDVYPFDVEYFAVTPTLLDEGSSFALEWSAVATASSYLVESSPNVGFSTIEWEQSLTDTVATVLMDPGSHYFRVSPRTPYTSGTFAGPGFGYVRGGGGGVVITSLGAAGAIPGEPVSIFGENLDFPGTQAHLGALTMTIVSASWGEIVALMPRDAATDKVVVSSLLGSDSSKDALVAQRIAYVTSGGEFAESFADLMATYSADVSGNGVVPIPVADLDWRDMSVFDVIVVANDTGKNMNDWGGGVPARAIAITLSGSSVLAMGDGGLAFLQVTSTAFRVSTTVASATSCYVPLTSAGAPIFQTPHSGVMSGSWVDVCANQERQLGLQNPSVTNLYASTSALSSRWVILDAQGGNQRYFYWGFAADPKGYTSQGQDFMANVMYFLYNARTVVPASPVH